jgi:hypothetical protein
MSDEDAVTDLDVAAAYAIEVLGKKVELNDGDVVNVRFKLRGDTEPSVSVFICNHHGVAGMAADDESYWRETDVVRELPGLGDSAFVVDEGTVFARLGDRYTIQILTAGDLDDEIVAKSTALARSILDRLDKA